MRKLVPFAIVIGLGCLGASYVVEPGKYTCRWTLVGYSCPDIPVATN